MFKGFKYAEEYDLEAILIGWSYDCCLDEGIIKTMIDIGPYEFLYYIQNAVAIFTTSFHGVALSINFNKNFFVQLDSNVSQKDIRINDLLELFELEERILSLDAKLDREIDWETVKEKLELEIDRSKKLLVELLDN